MKKAITLVLCVIMICFAPVPTSGVTSLGQEIPVQNKIFDKEEIELIARDIFNLSDDFVLSGSDFRDDVRNYKSIWYLYFNNEKTNKYLNCNLNAVSGELLSFNRNYDSNNDILLISRNEAKEYALSCIQEFNPDLSVDMVEVKESDISFMYNSYRSKYSYYFEFVMQYEEVLFPDNRITVQISGTDGEVLSYSKSWSDWAYNIKEPYLTDNIVKGIFKNQDFLKLKYIMKYDQDNDRYSLTPVYQYVLNEKNTGLLNAVTGEFISYDDLHNPNIIYKQSITGAAYTKAAEDSGAYYGTVPEKGVIPAEKAAEIIKERLAFLSDVKDMVVLSSDYFNSINGIKGKYWRIYLSNPKNKSYLSVIINGENEKIYNVYYYKDIYSSIAEVPVSDRRTVSDNVNSATEIANLLSVALTSMPVEQKGSDVLQKELINKLKNAFPELDPAQIDIGNFDTDSRNAQSSYWGYRMIKDIPYEGNSLRITVDDNTKDITSFSMNWTHDVEIEYEGASVKIIEAKNIFYNKAGFDLYFVQLKDKSVADYINIPLPDLIPVFAVKQTYFDYISAINGKTLDYNGQPVDEKPLEIVITDISGNKYERAIELMNNMGYLGDCGSLFHPEEPLLKKDIVKWLGFAFGDNGNYIPLRSSIKGENIKFLDFDINQNDYYAYINAVRLGVVNENEKIFYPEKQISVLEMCKMMINGIGLKRMAETGELFALDEYLPSLVRKDSGYIILGRFYEILDTQENDFNRIVTRGEAVQNIYDLLLFLRESM